MKLMNLTTVIKCFNAILKGTLLWLWVEINERRVEYDIRCFFCLQFALFAVFSVAVIGVVWTVWSVAGSIRFRPQLHGRAVYGTASSVLGFGRFESKLSIASRVSVSRMNVTAFGSLHTFIHSSHRQPVKWWSNVHS